MVEEAHTGDDGSDQRHQFDDAPTPEDTEAAARVVAEQEAREILGLAKAEILVIYQALCKDQWQCRSGEKDRDKQSFVEAEYTGRTVPNMLRAIALVHDGLDLDGLQL